MDRETLTEGEVETELREGSTWTRAETDDMDGTDTEETDTDGDDTDADSDDEDADTDDTDPS